MNTTIIVAIVLALTLACTHEATRFTTPVSTQTPTTTAPPMPTSTPEPQVFRGEGGRTFWRCDLIEGEVNFKFTTRGSRGYHLMLEDHLRIGERQGEGWEILFTGYGEFQGSLGMNVGSKTHELNPGPCAIDVDSNGSWTLEITQCEGSPSASSRFTPQCRFRK